MQIQAQPRIRKRIPCSLRIGGRRHSGLILNLSRGGLFVQTTAGGEPGAGLAVELNLGAEADALELDAEVVWRRVVAAHLRTITHAGVGLRIRRAPEPFYALLLRLQHGDGEAAPRAPAASAPTPPAASFRIRVKQTAGPRSKILTMTGASEAEARHRALAQTGHGWTVLEVERIA